MPLCDEYSITTRAQSSRRGDLARQQTARDCVRHPGAEPGPLRQPPGRDTRGSLTPKSQYRECRRNLAEGWRARMPCLPCAEHPGSSSPGSWRLGEHWQVARPMHRTCNGSLAQADVGGIRAALGQDPRFGSRVRPLTPDQSRDASIARASCEPRQGLRLGFLCGPRCRYAVCSCIVPGASNEQRAARAGGLRGNRGSQLCASTPHGCKAGLRLPGRPDPYRRETQLRTRSMCAGPFHKCIPLMC